MAKWIQSGIFKLGPDIVALFLFTLAWVVLIIMYGGKIHFVEGSTVLPLLIALSLLAVAFFSHVSEILSKSGKERITFFRRARRMARDWLPLIYLVGVYETLRDYTGIIRLDAIDGALLKLDIALFGVEPTVWIQKYAHPLLTDYFAVMYMLYFFLPMIVATFLYYENRRLEFRELTLGCVLCLYSGYVLYLIFPAGPPRFYEGITFDPPQLTGYFGIYDFLQGAMNNSNHVIHKASFPSLHVALSTLAILHAFRFAKLLKKEWLIAVNTWIAVSIWVATVYLRHHWVVDIFAGWVLGIAAYYGQIRLHQLWYGREKV